MHSIDLPGKPALGGRPRKLPFRVMLTIFGTHPCRAIVNFGRAKRSFLTEREKQLRAAQRDTRSRNL